MRPRMHRQALRALARAAVALTALGLAPAAAAQDQKVAIGFYHWSQQVVNVDLGQRVTWYWVGPDTMHSVTGTSANDARTDSDPTTSEPEHRVGDHFQVTFTVPGVYTFQCKLHPIVHGEVIVSAVPGDPNDDPEPVPPANVTLVRPTVQDVFLAPRAFSTRGTTLHFSLDQVAHLDAEIWHLGRHGRGRYAGWERWFGHIGFNQVPFAVTGPHFRPRPGRYVVYLAATDPSNNVSRTVRRVFTISATGAHARGP